MVSKSNCKVIYLDENCWIEIAKRYYGKSTRLEKKLVDNILLASEEGQAIFPLSISHLEETMHIARAVC